MIRISIGSATRRDRGRTGSSFVLRRGASGTESLIDDSELRRRMDGAEHTEQNLTALKTVSEGSMQRSVTDARPRARFPREGAYGLMAQIRRGRFLDSIQHRRRLRSRRDAELVAFALLSGSASELEYRVLVDRDLKLLQPDAYKQLSNKLSRSNACSPSWFRS